jgi:hypothetical protein
MKKKNGCQRWFLFFGILGPIIFIGTTMYRFRMEGWFDGWWFWLLGSTLLLLWLIKAFIIVTSTSGDTASDRATSWLNTEWVPRYQILMEKYNLWARTGHARDLMEFRHYKGEFERWTIDQEDLLYDFKLQFKNNIVSHSWENIADVTEIYERLKEGIKNIPKDTEE